MNHNPLYYRQVIPNNKRRALWHDYRSRCIYMVTISKSPQAPEFGEIININEPTQAYVDLSTLGEIIKEEIDATPLHHCEIKVLARIIMPDHLHALLFVITPIKKHLGEIIQAIKSTATRRIREALSNPSLSVFEDGFHDRILTRYGQLETIFRYIRENPYRLAMRRSRPDFFRRVNSLEIDGVKYQAYGNLQLLDNPFKEAVIVHRRDTQAERDHNRRLWLYTAAGGGVLVSPFISPAEKAIRAEADSLGGKTILITDRPFPDRFKPAARDFDRCTSGRLLIISAPAPDTDTPLSRSHCLAMNALASRIASV